MRFAAAASLLAVVLPSCGGGRPENGEVAGSSWSRAASMSQRRSYVAAAQVGNAVYVAGGMVGETGRHLATFQRFDPGAHSWTTLEQLPVPVRAADAAAVGGRIFVIGGTTPDGGGRQVFSYDVIARRWERRAPLPEPRFNHAAVSLGGRLYVLGGFAATAESDDVFVYDPARNRWSTAPSLPRPLHAFGAVAFGGELWVIGGRRGQRIVPDVSIYSPRTRRWRKGPALLRPMELLGAATTRNGIHVVSEHTYQFYDARERVWRVRPGPAVPRHALSLFAVDGALYAIGGCTTRLKDSAIVEKLPLKS